MVKVSEKTRARIEAWIEDELASPPGLGEGRNNFILKIAPRMFEVGWTRSRIYDSIVQSFGEDSCEGRESEIENAIENSMKYVQAEVDELSLKELAERKAYLQGIMMTARRSLPGILRDYHWPESEISKLGGMKSMPGRDQTKLFIESMWTAADVIWLGNTYHSGSGQYKTGKFRGKFYDHADHFKAQEEWLSRRLPNAWEFISHCTFKPGSNTRSNACVEKRKYMVVESDTLSRDQIGSVFCYLVHELGLSMRAVVYSGGKSLHGWFDWPEAFQDIARIQEISHTLTGLDCDPSTLRPSQPVRLAGIVRQDSSKVQSLLYIED